ncbi:MAG: thiamine-phosphate kinase [Actinomycetaceae bacterium]|nr:thiamine-phosphate kinase [Actinomycetaceae bacterium]
MSSESELIARMREMLPEGERTLLGSGDDCAKIAAPEGSFLVTTDALVEGRHFRLDWSTPFEIGRRAAAQNLADIAAMGARPSGLVVSMVLPDYMDEEATLEIVRGFGTEVWPTGAGVVGGDVTGGDQLVLAVTAFGYGGAVTRAGARPGDTLAIAGDLGVSGVGLALLDRGIVDSSLHTKEELDIWHYPVSFYRVPIVRYEAGVRAAKAGASAMMDVSDGLGKDLARLGRASGVAVRLSGEALAKISSLHEPWLSAAMEALGWSDPLELFSLGEDHALLAAFPAGVQIPDEFEVIGQVVEGEPGSITLGGKPFKPSGWDHLERR